jgi:hypothetical protein
LFAFVVPLDPGGEPVRRGLLIADSLREIMLPILEHDAAGSNVDGVEHRARLFRRVGLVSQPATVFLQDDQLVVDQLAVANGAAHHQHAGAARSHPLLLYRPLCGD